MKTQLFTLLLAIVAGIGTMHAAIVNGTCGDNLTWELNTKDSTLTIEGSGTMTSTPWSEYMNYIKYVSFPEGITSIASEALSNCSGLTYVTIPNSVTSIGVYAFEGCAGLASIEIPNSVTSIEKGAFSSCTGLMSVLIPNSVTSIGVYAFKGCAGLASIEIPNSITSISNSAFEGCAGLTSVEIPNSVTSIKKGAFARCTGLTNVTIPNSVTTIGDNAFKDCSALTSIIIPNSILTIGDGAFANCNLTSITCEAVVPPTITSSTFSNKSILIFVPEESLEAYQNALYWEEYTNIRAIGSAPLVQFLDWDGTVLSSANVTIGTSATPPANPTRTGYTFIGWDKDFSNITGDLVVTAQYKINRYKVDFIDWDNTVLKSDSVDYNSAAVAPSNPSREGHEFIGWDKDFSYVVSDMVVTAQYAVTYYPVSFLNYDGTLLSEQSIAYNQAAMEPEVPAREGYTFIGWTADITHITTRTFAIALYEKQGLLLVTYKKEDGGTISSENVDIHLPEAPIISGKTFAGWLTETADNTNGIVLRATYTTDNPTTGGDVVIDPSSTTAGVSFPYITGALTYVLIIRDLSGNVVCKIMFNANGQLLGIAFAPSRNNAPQHTQSEGFHFTVEGLTPGTTYEYEFVAHDETDQVIKTLTGSFTTTEDEMGVSNVSSSSAPQKVINEGNVFILRGDKTYTVTGAEVK